MLKKTIKHKQVIWTGRHYKSNNAFFVAALAILFSVCTPNWGSHKIEDFVGSNIYAADYPSKILLLIAEQNIGSSVYYWWGTTSQEVNLSIVEPVIYKGLIKNGFEVVDHSAAFKVDKPFRVMDMGESGAVQVGKSYGADLVVIGKALATQGGKVPGSANMVSSNATLTGKVIRIRDGKVVAYVSGSGDSIHLNPITGGNEALEKAAEEFTTELTSELSQLKDKKGE